LTGDKLEMLVPPAEYGRLGNYEFCPAPKQYLQLSGHSYEVEVKIM